MHFELDAIAIRLLEESADELARLDVSCQLAPVGLGLAFRFEAIAGLAALAVAPSAVPAVTQATAEVRASLAAASVDAVHGGALPAWLGQLLRVVEEEERRARSGAALSASRFDGLALVRDAAALQDALRPGGQPRSVLVRAVDAASAADTHSWVGALIPALVLCAAGQLARVWLLPFAGIDAAAAEQPEAFARHALGACASNAGERRIRARRMLGALDGEEDALAPLGRAAITARLALAELRTSLVTTMPVLAERLACSRPAAGDALERLVGVGLAVEITGRSRDRVFAHRAFWEG
jgi:hypothetical protein